MFKFVIFVGLLAAAASQSRTIVTPTAVKVGQLTQRIPTAVSRQSQTVVHDHANVVSDIVAPATLVRNVVVSTPRTYQPSSDTLAYLAQPRVVYSIEN